MTLLCFAALLPALFWDQGPETAHQLKQAGITQVLVPPCMEAAWQSPPGFSIRAGDPQSALKLVTPGVQLRVNQASATRSPWLDSNGWRFLRHPGSRFYYHAPGPGAALAAAEAFMYGVNAMVHTDAAGLQPLGGLLVFLGQLKNSDLPALADIGFIDDGSPPAGEVLNLLLRRNLLVRIVSHPDPRLGLNVPFGSARYPRLKPPTPPKWRRRSAPS